MQVPAERYGACEQRELYGAECAGRAPRVPCAAHAMYVMCVTRVMCTTCVMSDTVGRTVRRPAVSAPRNVTRHAARTSRTAPPLA
ncbi:hypothetical protein EAO76_30430 [Streptomyces sp. sk2.1]|nr:hypothetical protein EAO76_30430 [Streptomyces sp. sk2.1]